MRTVPPENFCISDFYKGIYTFQKWALFPGHSTQGPKNVIEHMHRLQIPERLDGLRVLDIAPWNGFFSFECARRGAAEVMSLGPDDPEATGYNKTRELLQLDNCHYVRASVYDLSPDKHGIFDIVLFLGLIYHLRHPLLALDRIYDVAKDRLFTDSPVIDKIIFDKTVTDNQRQQILMQGKILHELLPMVYYTKGAETGDPYNWFMPNKRAFKDFVESSGFTVNRFTDDGGGWAWLAASKAARSFTPGVEGWNEGAARADEIDPLNHSAAQDSAAQAERDTLRKRMPRDEFIAALELKTSIAEISFVDHPRFAPVFELVNKASQFNTTGRRWTREECEAYFKTGNVFYAFHVKDRFSDFGVAGCLMVSGNKIEQFVMSSRIVGLDIEMAIEFALEGRLRARGMTEIIAQLIDTKDNVSCHDFYANCGFEREGDLWIKSLDTSHDEKGTNRSSVALPEAEII